MFGSLTKGIANRAIDWWVGYTLEISFGVRSLPFLCYLSFTLILLQACSANGHRILCSSAHLRKLWKKELPRRRNPFTTISLRSGLWRTPSSSRSSDRISSVKSIGLRCILSKVWRYKSFFALRSMRSTYTIFRGSE